jgi:hypothetical protein
MRHLVVPACLCLVTWSSSTGTVDRRISLEQSMVVRVIDQDRATTDHDKPRISPSVNSGILPATDDTADTASSLTHLKRTDVAALSPHRDSWVDFEPLQLVSPPPPPPAAAKPVIPRTREEICDTLARAASNNNLPAPFFIRLLFQESRFNAEVVSHAGALGIAQFMPETIDDVGLDNPFDPVQAISASARHLGALVDHFGNLGLAAAAYNAGPGRIQEWLLNKTKLPDETEGYVKIVTGRPAENWKQLNAGVPDMGLPPRAPCRETANLYAWIAPPEIPLPQMSPWRVAERLAAAAREDRLEAERKLAALISMRTIMRNSSVKVHRKGSVQLAARGHDKNQKLQKKK